MLVSRVLVSYYYQHLFTHPPILPSVHTINNQRSTFTERQRRQMVPQLMMVQLKIFQLSVQLPTLCDPMNLSTPGLPVHQQLPEFTQTHVHESVMPSNHLILCHTLLMPSLFPNIRVFSNKSALLIMWPKYWSFSFNISPSSEHPGLISFRMDWLDLLAVQGTLK